ncbi:MAG: ribosomal protein [Actinoallomurus sp.]|nr:ribosomal protein [Actinoallomurus sp.]
MRPGRLGPEPLDLVLLVVGEVAFVPVPVRALFPRQDVGRDAVEEPPVVRGDHRAAGELQQGVLQGAEGLDIEVVGGLVQQQHIAALLQGEGEAEAVALTAGQHGRPLLLVRPLEAECGDVGTARHLDLADLDVVETVGDDLPDVLLRVDAATALIDVGDLERVADLQDALVRLLGVVRGPGGRAGPGGPDDHAEQRGLADAVRADDADDAVRRQVEREVLHQQPVGEALREVLRDDHRVAQARARRDLDLLEVELAVLGRLGRHLLVSLQTGPALGLARLGVGADPLQLILQALLLLDVLLTLDLESLGLLLQVGGVVALVRVAAPPVELEDPAGHVVEEVPVVGDRQHGALVLFQELLQPLHALGVQVVGRLVEEQQVGRFEQQLAQRHAPALSTGEVGDLGVRRGAAQGVHRLLELAVQIPRVAVVELLLELAHLIEQLVGVVGRHLLGDLVEPVEHRLGLGDALLDVAQDGLVLVERGLLLQHADREAGHDPGVAVGRLLDAGHHPQQRRLTGAIGPKDTDLGSGQEAEGDIVKDDLVAMRLAHALHRIDVLRHVLKPMASEAMALPRRRDARKQPTTAWGAAR